MDAWASAHQSPPPPPTATVPPAIAHRMLRSCISLETTLRRERVLPMLNPRVPTSAVPPSRRPAAPRVRLSHPAARRMQQPSAMWVACATPPTKVGLELGDPAKQTTLDGGVSWTHSWRLETAPVSAPPQRFTPNVFCRRAGSSIKPTGVQWQGGGSEAAQCGMRAVANGWASCPPCG